MSKNIKYISSDHFGSPVMKGDRWGYCVEMLRTCLVTGFNERTDLNKVEVLDSNVMKLSFATAHNYVPTQTIKLSAITYPELNTEVFITSVQGLTITVKSYVDLSGFVGQVLDNINAKSIVAPLGMIEKFKDGNRSVFTTDEEKAFLYIDDTTSPLPNGYFQCPLVYMASKMSDIDSASGNIFPYDSANPTRYKEKNWKLPNGNDVTGLLNFMTFGAYKGSYPPNDATQQQIPIKYSIIGNGRMFYFLPILNISKNIFGSQTDKIPYIFAFGKTYVESNSMNPHVLLGNPIRTDWGSYAVNRVATDYCILPYTNRSSANAIVNTDLGGAYSAMLSVNGVPKALNFFPSNQVLLTSNGGMESIMISGGGTKSGAYPNPYTNKYYISKTNLYDNSKNKIGTMSGLMWTQNPSTMMMPNGSISKFRYKGKNKYLYTYSAFNNTYHNLDLASGWFEVFTYQISLDYEDWRNYE